jgi:sugar lactone lactonase YvrE
MGAIRVVVDGLGFPESTRWHDGRVWLCNWGAGEVLAVTVDGVRDVMARVDAQALPFSIDWDGDGRLLVIDGPRRVLWRQQADGSLEQAADLSALGTGPGNELVVAPGGVAYVNGGSGAVVRVQLDGAADQVADELQWPNGMAVIDDGATLVVADSHAQRLIAFDVTGDGALSGRRVWAEVAHAPDGICSDADGAIWVASVPGRHCVRVREGGEVLNTVVVDRGCFACMLGGDDGHTLFIAAAQWHGMEAAMRDGPGQTGQLLAAPGQPAPHAGHP